MSSTDAIALDVVRNGVIAAHDILVEALGAIPTQYVAVRELVDRARADTLLACNELDRQLERL